MQQSSQPRHVPLTCQGDERLADFLLQPMSLDGGSPCAVGIVPEPYCLAHPVEQFLVGGLHLLFLPI